MTCIPGVIHYNDAKIQLLDLPGIIEGAADGKGRGKQVIAVAKNSDMILMVLEATKAEEHKVKISRELEKVGIRLNKSPPLISITPTKLGGVKLNSTKALTHLNEKVVKNILSEYKIHNADVLVHDDSTVDDFIDMVEGNPFLTQATESTSSASTATTRLTPSRWRRST